MEWPKNRTVTIKSLATGNPQDARPITAVNLLGSGEVAFEQTAAGLVVTLPAEAPTPNASCLQIHFAD